MKVSNTLLASWERDLLHSSVEVRSLRSLCLRIMLMGIMLNLLGFGVILWCVQQLNKKPSRLLYKLQESTNGLYLIPLGYAKHPEAKCLAHILEIGTPIGMLAVTPPGIPLAEASLLGSFSRSFDPIPEVSSEGFLVSFTPWGFWKSSVYDFWLFSEEFCNGVIQVPRITAEKLQQGRVSTEDHGYQIRLTLPSQGKEFNPCSIVTGPGFLTTVPMGSSSTEPETRRLQRGLPRGPVVVDLMTTRTPPGILESLNPTDETLRKGRNTKIGAYES